MSGLPRRSGPLLVLLFLVPACTKPVPPPFLRRLQTFPPADYFHGIRRTRDGGFILAGATQTRANGPWTFTLLKTDRACDKVWMRSYGEALEGRASSVDEASDGGFLVTGSILSKCAGAMDVGLLKTDARGELLWVQAFGGPWDDEGYTVRGTADGGGVVSGCTGSFGAGKMDVYLVKVDRTGALQWQQTFGAENHDGLDAAGVQPTRDGGFMLAAATVSSSLGAKNRNVYLIRTDGLGQKVWDKVYASKEDTMSFSVEETPERAFIIGGKRENALYVLKIDAMGNLLWEGSYGTNVDDNIACARATPDGGCIIVGRSLGGNEFTSSILAVKTDGRGRAQWQNMYGRDGKKYYSAYSVELSDEGGYVISGMFGGEGLVAQLVP